MNLGEKQLLRNRVTRLLDAMTPQERANASARIREHLYSLDAFRSARIIYGFAPLKSEPDWIGPSLPKDKIFAFPRVEGILASFYLTGSVEELVCGRMGVREPQPIMRPPAPDLILVPGLVFDRLGHRVGRGAGYYDRILADLTGHRLAICFFSQLVASVPFGPLDQRMNAILTENGPLSCGGEPSRTL